MKKQYFTQKFILGAVNFIFLLGFIEIIIIILSLWGITAPSDFIHHYKDILGKIFLTTIILFLPITKIMAVIEGEPIFD